MKRIDCLGEICPVPLLRLKDALKDMTAGGSVLLITECSCTLRSVEEYCNAQGFAAQAEEAIPGVWEILVTR